MFNRSLLTGPVLTVFKTACITPLQKKPGLDSADVCSYRPISNLSVLVSFWNLDYLSVANLLPKLQSAYRAYHSTETAVLKVPSDMLWALDAGDLALLTLLDRSAAFDTSDLTTLLQQLKTLYSLDGCVLGWFMSYLNGCTQFVCCPTSALHLTSSLCKVPPGSFIGPIMFLFCTYLLSLGYVATISSNMCVFVCSYDAACHSEVEKLVALAVNHNVVIIPFGGKSFLNLNFQFITCHCFCICEWICHNWKLCSQ